jgi:GT2 family glycosyltransferase
VIIVSTNEARWLERSLPSVFAHAGDARVEVIVVDNNSNDGTRDMIQSAFSDALLVTSDNRGFSHANNRGLEVARARYALMLNPDTEVVEGDFGELVAALDTRPEVGLAGVRQIAADGTLWPTIRRFPSTSRALGEAFGSERWPVHASWTGERVLDEAVYQREQDCDWVSGSFMLARHRALLATGLLDERFFIYSEETDLCLRMRRAGFRVRHLPQMTIIHHAGKGGLRPKMVAQDAYSRRQYAAKHLGPAQLRLYLGAVGLRHALRAMPTGRGDDARRRREGARRALGTLTGRIEPPFGAPPATALDGSAGDAIKEPVSA